MCQIRITFKLKEIVGELDLSIRDLADLCDVQPGVASGWVSGLAERLSLVDLATLMTRLEVYNLYDVLDVKIIGDPMPPDGRRERIMKQLEPLRKKRKANDRDYRKRKAEKMRREIEEEVLRKIRGET